MMPKIVPLVVCAMFLMTVQSRSSEKLDDDTNSDEEQHENKPVLESLKEFVSMVDKYNLNVSIIASQKKYYSGGSVKEDMSVTMHFPVNGEHLTEVTLEDDKQDKYLEKLKKLAKKENVGIKARVIKIENGGDKLVVAQEVNEQHLIDSPSYKLLTSFKDGVQGFCFPDNDTNEILYNYVIDDGSDPVRNIQVITGQVIINELQVSKDFPANVLQEIKNVLPKLWLGTNDYAIIARHLSEHLEHKFSQHHEVIVGVENFGLNGKKFAHLQIADSNVLVLTYL